MLSRIHDLVSEDSQFIIATHSPILLSFAGAIILEFTDEGVQETPLEETSHYQIMKQFFDDKERMLHYLLK
ncbi:hypothetical protein [Sporosarcina sp. P2]|uniref:hypothetical protein n=1 Tax=Sporosarcina sp. P2 TaxID=2048251 RepID=UPI00351059AB